MLVAAAIRETKEGAWNFEGHGRRVDDEGCGGVEIHGGDIGGEAEEVFLFGLVLRFELRFELWVASKVGIIVLEIA